MKTLNFSIDIQAPKEKVWQILWGEKTYPQWTSAFMEGSYAISDWDEGGKILFLDPKGEGMFSTIAKMVPNEYMSFKHLGYVKDGKEQPIDESVKEWTGAMENYTLKEDDQYITHVTVDVDVSGEEWENMVTNIFPSALNKVKELSEE